VPFFCLVLIEIKSNKKIFGRSTRFPRTYDQLEETKVKKLLLAGMIAFAVPAYADQHVTLPDTMLGTWCPIETGSTEDNSIFHYERTNDPSNCSDPALHVRKEGYTGFWDECVFDKIEPEGSAYLVHMRCEAQSEGGGGGIGIFWTLNVEYKIVDGRLVVTMIPET
jgi:hypothetical protein